MMFQSSRFGSILLAGALFGAIAAQSPAQAATVIVINNDGAGEGFNDPTAVAPVGGNSGTTIGQQRLIAFQRAADVWGGLLISNVPIRVQAQFNPLSCTANSATLGSAGPTNGIRDFPGAPRAGTYYAIALANALRGADNDTTINDIDAQFSSTIGTPGCLQNSGWYYGLDGATPGNRIDFFAVLLHELGHGLGFLTFVNLASGAKANGFDDIFMVNLENHGASPADYPSMSNAQRVAASIATGNLHWIGANVRNNSGFLTAGRVGDHVRMFAPNPQQSGSSVSHWDTVLTPDQLMEPVYTGPIHVPNLELKAFKDIGWTINETGPPVGPPTVHDYDGNGTSDLVFRNVDGTAALFLMTSNQLNGSAAYAGIPPSYQIVGQRDFNNDGRTDWLIRDIGSGNTIMWFFNAFQVYYTYTLGVVPPAWGVAGTGDFNGDGKGDILWVDTSGNVAIWLMNGPAVLSSTILGQVPTAWTVNGVADFNGDGKRDILWRDTLGYIAFWFMNGTTITSGPIIGQLTTDWTIVGTGDFDGDGKADIVFRDTQGYVAIWLMDGPNLKVGALLGQLTLAWTIVETGDFNGDGKSDIVFRDTSGNNAIWFMNGTTVAVSLLAPAVPTDWSLVGQNAD